MSHNSASSSKGQSFSSEGTVGHNRLSRTESYVTTDSDWTSEFSDSLENSQDSEVFQTQFRHQVDQLPGPPESSARAAEYVKSLALQHIQGEQAQESKRRRRIWSERCGSKRGTRESRIWSSDGTGFSSISSTFSSANDSVNVSQWVEDSLDNSIFDATVTAEADETIVEDERKVRTPSDSDRYPLSKQSTISDDTSHPEGLTRTLTQETLQETLRDRLPPMTNLQLVQSPSSTPSSIIQKRKQFQQTLSWESSLESEQSIKSITSVDELLDVVNDPASFLLNLGFGRSTADPLERIPRRFLEEESSAMGISVEKYQQEVREKERGYDFCLTGGLRGLERFLRKQLDMSGMPISPYSGSPVIGSPRGSPQREHPPPFPDVGHLSNGVYEVRKPTHQVFVPLPVNALSSSAELPPNVPLSRHPYLSQHEYSGESFMSDTSFDSEFSSSSDFSDRSFDWRKSKPKAKRLQMANSSLDTVDEESESQLRAKSPCPPTSLFQPPAPPRSESQLPPGEIVEENFSQMALGEEAAPGVVDSVRSEGDAINAIKGHLIGSDLGNLAQDSFEIEEISTIDFQGDDHQTERGTGEDKRETFVRNESQQSDSSGFADEGTESISPASPQHEQKGDGEDVEGELGDERTKTKDSDSDTRFEPNNNLESRSLIEDGTSDNPAGNNNVPDVHKNNEEKEQSGSEEEEDFPSNFRRPRSGTFPFTQKSGSSIEAPNTVIAVLEQLQKNFQIAEKEMEKSKSGKETQERRRQFSKMETVDCDNYSFSSSPARDKETSSKREDLMSSLDPLLGIESAMKDQNFEEVTQTSHLPVADFQSNSEDSSIADRTPKLERLESEDATHLSHRKGHPSSDDDGKRSNQMLDRELGLDTASIGLEERQKIETQRELQDLKLMQRALFKYKQELWELEEWSSQMYDEEADQEVEAHVRKELESLDKLRQKVKNEVQRMEDAIETHLKDVISRRGSMDSLSHRFAHWSFNHIDVLNKMVSLMKEQSSFRKHLEQLKNSKDEMEAVSLQPPPSGNLYKALSRDDLVHELVNTQLELARLKVMARTEMTAAIVEMKKCIVTDIRKEVNRELRLMQWQLQDRDEQIEQLKESLKRTKQNSDETKQDSKHEKDKSRETPTGEGNKEEIEEGGNEEISEKSKANAVPLEEDTKGEIEKDVSPET